jgi:amino-acid N-acetyltransferase
VPIQPVSVTPEVKALLANSALPIDDVDDPTIELYGALDGDCLVGVVGLQMLDGAGLLRSLAVLPSARDRGLGGQLCETILREAKIRGLSELWLLTTSARDYFARRGFAAVARDQVPTAVRATTQFTSSCPSSAVVMRRPL